MHTATLAHRSRRSEFRALLAIAQKEWTLFRRYPSWVIAFFIWPVLLPFGYIFSAKALAGPQGAALDTFRELAGTTDYVGFIVVGSLLWQWLNLTLWDVGFQLRNEQMRGTLESNWLCPVWRISILLGSSLTKLGIAIFFLAISVLEFRLFFGVQVLGGDPALLLLIVVLSIACIYGLGIAFGSLVLRFKEADAMVFLVRGVFMIFCGITFPLQVLPAWMQTIAAWLPLTYAIHATRAVVLADADFATILPDLQRLALFAVILPITGYWAFHITERRARRSGALGQY
jgi:ABC-2 type transport system permease protein